MANQSIEAFFELLRAGLWGTNAQLSQFQEVDYKRVYKIAEEQSVLGLIAAGIENTHDSKISQEDALAFVGSILQIEQRNKAMNQFLISLFRRLEDNGISSVLVKGQGVAQCYERPLWRACGDVDLLLDDNYYKAKQLLVPLASTIEKEDVSRKHLGITIGVWSVELHGTLRGGWSTKVDKGIDKIQKDTFKNKHVRIWAIDGVEIPLPSPDNDVIFIFTHILQHFFLEGVGLRQICDWCRLLWIFRYDINYELLEKRLSSMQLMAKWQSFASFAINYLGMPKELMPLYTPKKKWHKNAEVILSLVMEKGNFGHNRDLSYQKKYPFLISKAITFSLATKDNVLRFRMFPLDSIRVWSNMVCEGVRGIVTKIIR